MEDHDQRFKNLIQACLKEFMELFFPQWAERFDWSSIEFLSQEAFVDPPRGERKYLDLVAKVSLREPHQISLRSAEHCVLLIHIEVESSTSVASFHPRMFDYFAWLRGKHHLPVLPIGLFLRVGFDGVGWITYEESLWDECLVQFRYPYVGLPKLPAMEYLEGENLLGVALSALMRVSKEERTRLKTESYRRLASESVDEYKRFLMLDVVEAYLPLEGEELAEFERLMQSPKYRGARMLAETTFERGQRVGRDGAQISMLKRQLLKKFGNVQEALCKQIEDMTFEQREQLAEDLMSATSLEQLGLR